MIIDVLVVTDNHSKRPLTCRVNVIENIEVKNYLLTRFRTSFCPKHEEESVWMNHENFEECRWDVEELFDCAFVTTEISSGDLFKRNFKG